MKIHISDDEGVLLQSITDYKDADLIGVYASDNNAVFELLDEVREAIRAEIHSMRLRRRKEKGG